LLHPFTPFITEEIYHQLKERDDDVCIAKWPVAPAVNNDLLKQCDNAKEVITKIREIRAKVNLPKKDRIKAYVKADQLNAYADYKPIIEKLSGLEALETTAEDLKGLASFVANGDQFFVDTGVEIDVEAEKKKMEEELKYTKGFAKSIDKKLSNESFVSNAPEAVVGKERQKLEDAQAKILLLEEQLGRL